MRCLTCGLVQIAPTPTSQEVRALYAHDWPHFSPYQSQRSAHQAYFSRILTFLLPLVSAKKRLRILDIGSATGILLSEAGRRGIEAVGVDVSHDAVAYCRTHGLTAFEGTAKGVARRNKWRHRFDVVTACQVIEHEQDPLAFFETIRHVLTPGGIVIVTTPNYDTPWRKVMGTRWIGYQHPEHLFFFTPGTLSLFLTKAKLNVSLVRPDFPRPYLLGYAFRRLREYIPGMEWGFGPFERLLKDVQISVPVNPWGDMLLVAKRLV